MWFPTKEKVQREILRMLAECEILDKRIEVYEDQSKILGSMFGPAPEVAQWRDSHTELSQTLLEASWGINNGSVSFKEMVPALKPVSGALSQFRTVLDQTDQASAQGRAAANAYFGK